MITFVHLPQDALHLRVYRWSLEVCDGNETAAKLLWFFMCWHEYKIKGRQQDVSWSRKTLGTNLPARIPTEWQWWSDGELQDALLGTASKNTVRKAVSLLCEKGLIVKNTEYKIVTLYKCIPSEIQKAIRGVSSPDDDQFNPDHDQFNPDQPEVKSEQPNNIDPLDPIDQSKEEQDRRVEGINDPEGWKTKARQARMKKLDANEPMSPEERKTGARMAEAMTFTAEYKKFKANKREISSRNKLLEAGVTLTNLGFTPKDLPRLYDKYTTDTKEKTPWVNSFTSWVSKNIDSLLESPVDAPDVEIEYGRAMNLLME